MVHWQVWLYVYVILILKPNICFGSSKTHVTSGPYKIIILRVDPCKKVSRPFVENPPFHSTPVAYNISDKTYISLNLSIHRETSNFKIRMTSYLMENGKWIPTYFVNDFGCRGVVLSTVLTAIGVKYNSDKCMLLKGDYYFANFDINGLLHMWMKKVEYGMTKWKVEITNRAGTLLCYEYYINNIPWDN